MKVSKKVITIVEVYNHENGKITTKAAFEELSDAIEWVTKANEANAAVGIEEFYEYEWRRINLYERIEEEERES